jgi:hypothetical protein
MSRLVMMQIERVFLDSAYLHCMERAGRGAGSCYCPFKFIIRHLIGLPPPPLTNIWWRERGGGGTLIDSTRKASAETG